MNYAGVLKPTQVVLKFVPLKPVMYLQGEPRVIWEEHEVEQMIVNENLQYAFIENFLYGWPDIQDLHKMISKQCELKGVVILDS